MTFKKKKQEDTEIEERTVEVDNRDPDIEVLDEDDGEVEPINANIHVQAALESKDDITTMSQSDRKRQKAEQKAAREALDKTEDV